MHGVGLPIEAVRQLFGTYTNQVLRARVALAAAGPDGRGDEQLRLLHCGGGRVSVLPVGFPGPRSGADGLEQLYWTGAQSHELLVQRCARRSTWRWGPGAAVCARPLLRHGMAPRRAPRVVFSWQRVWHPVHATLNEAVPYVVVQVQLAHAGGSADGRQLRRRSLQNVVVGNRVRAVFEDHAGDAPYTLVQRALEQGERR